MPEVSDVDLMELADGRLAEPRRRAVEAEVTKDPELQERLEAFRATGTALAHLFDPVMEASLPSALLETVRGAVPTPAPRVLHLIAGTEPVKGRQRVDRAAVNGWRFSGMAWAAGLVAAVSLGAAVWALQPNGASNLAAASLASALETTRSGQTAGVSLPGHGPGSLKLELSFLHVDGRYCRQYAMSLESGTGFAGYACRVGTGWHVEKEAEIAPSKVDLPGVIRPAGPSPAAKAIEDAVGNVIRGDPLEPDSELALIGRGWPSSGNR